MMMQKSILYGGVFGLVIVCNMAVLLAYDCSMVERYACQATYYDQYREALASYPKAKIDVNRFYASNRTCVIQCILKTGSKTIQSLEPIETPNFVQCSAQISKYPKLKQFCYNGDCLPLSQIYERIGSVTTPSPVTSPNTGAPTQPGVFWENWN